MPGMTAMKPAINDKRVLASLPLILYSGENENAVRSGRAKMQRTAPSVAFARAIVPKKSAVNNIFLVEFNELSISVSFFDATNMILSI